METKESTESPPGVSSIIRVPAEELESHPLLDQITNLINVAFMTSWASIPGLVSADYKRYDNTSDFVREVQPDCVLYVALNAEGRPVATVGYRQWEEVWRHLNAMESSYRGKDPATGSVTTQTSGVAGNQQAPYRSPDAIKKTVISDKYEIVLLTVDPRLKGKGLSTPLVRRVEKVLEGKTRLRGSKKLTLMVRAGKESNEGYWSQKGYREVAERRFGPGYGGSVTGFSLLDMEKVIEV